MPNGDLRHGGWWAKKRKAAARTLPVRCELCGHWVRHGDRWDLDHVRPVSKGGMLGPTRVTHERCNRKRWNKGDDGRRTFTEPPSRAW